MVEHTYIVILMSRVPVPPQNKCFGKGFKSLLDQNLIENPFYGEILQIIKLLQFDGAPKLSSILCIMHPVNTASYGVFIKHQAIDSY